MKSFMQQIHKLSTKLKDINLNSENMQNVELLSKSYTQSSRTFMHEVAKIQTSK